MAQTQRSAKATIDHDTIRQWVEAREGCPAHVKRTGKGDDPGVLRIDYTGFSGTESLEPISWEEFFEAFEDNGLAFLYQDVADSRFSKLVSREGVELTDEKKSATRKTSAKTATRSASSKSASGSTAGKSAKTQAKSTQKASPGETSGKAASPSKSTRQSKRGGSQGGHHGHA